MICLWRMVSRQQTRNFMVVIFVSTILLHFMGPFIALYAVSVLLMVAGRMTTYTYSILGHVTSGNYLLNLLESNTTYRLVSYLS